MPATIASLPRKLVDVITRNASKNPENRRSGFDTKALCRLALVSRQWREAAQADLWKHLMMITESDVRACLASPALGRHTTISVMFLSNWKTVILLIAALRGVKELSLSSASFKLGFDSTILRLPALSDLESLSIYSELDGPIPQILPFRLHHLTVSLAISPFDLTPLLSQTSLAALTSLRLHFIDTPTRIRPTILEALEKIAPQLARLVVIAMPDIARHPFFAAFLRSCRQLSELRLGPALRGDDAKHFLSAIPGTLTSLNWWVYGAPDLVVLEEWLRSPGSPQRLEVLQLVISYHEADRIKNASDGSTLLAWCEENDVQIFLN